MALLLALGISLASCASEGTFSSFPGFREYFREYPPKSKLPTEQERALLERYRPRIYLAEGQDELARGALSKVSVLD
ncbi:MAG: hypothetical protein ACPGSC_14390, partial [Granulosicoccaceae bacterium]